MHASIVIPPYIIIYKINYIIMEICTCTIDACTGHPLVSRVVSLACSNPKDAVELGISFQFWMQGICYK